MARFLSRTLGVSLACWLLIACGGEAVVDAIAAGGHGGGTTTGTDTGSTTTGTGTGSVTTGTGAGMTTCEQLQEEAYAWFDAATACDPNINGLQCTGQTVVYDDCGCPVVASDYNGGAAQSAVVAYDAWVAAGCGPWDCYACPPGPDTPWYCDMGTEHCMPAYE